MVRLSREFEQLLDLYGVQSTYRDVHDRRRRAPVDSLLAALRALGANLDSPNDARDTLLARRREMHQRGVEPVMIAWDGKPFIVDVSLPADHADGTMATAITTESGEILTEVASRNLETVSVWEDGGRSYVIKRLRLLRELPFGYHKLTIETVGGVAESLIISTPSRSYSPPQREQRPEWGVFLPLYALRTRNNWGAGDFSDLGSLAEWTAALGGRVVGTLPLLAAFLDGAVDPSPYSPVSRLFWNEFYIDVTAIPELQACPVARKKLESVEFSNALRQLQDAPYVEYERIMARKREVLELLADHFHCTPSERFAQFTEFLDSRAELRDYACFRATCERRRVAWQQWPGRMQGGHLEPGDWDSSAERYHLYVQWVAAEQLQSVSQRGSNGGAALYLDLPLGVRRDGYDVWRHRSQYVSDASAGAPPDAVFTKGQDWNFAPLHPHHIREQGYRHVRDYLARHMSLCRLLRIDHVMNLHRLYWIPAGMQADQGCYVRYRANELYALLNLESHRHRTRVAGEDLGTVPEEVRDGMQRHGMRRLFVVQYELGSKSKPLLPAVPRKCVASLNTHDMPPFSAWWEGDDIPDRIALGLLDESSAQNERADRESIKRRLVSMMQEEGKLGDDETGVRTVIRALVRWLSSSSAEIVLINLEDLWGERQPHNTPGTGAERPNWRCRARYFFEQFSDNSPVVDILREVSRLRSLPFKDEPRDGAEGAPGIHS